MEKVIEILNLMQADGVFEKFAIGGGIAAIYYLEPYQTDDIDVFFAGIFWRQRLGVARTDLRLFGKARLLSC